MTDHELIELAAKAAGINGEWMQDAKGLPFLHNWDTGCEFDPLSNDGDALRLAVKLRVLVDVNHAAGALVMWHLRSLVEPWGDDPYAATRRAIVRGAAEIGKQIKGGQHGTEY